MELVLLESQNRCRELISGFSLSKSHQNYRTEYHSIFYPANHLNLLDNSQKMTNRISKTKHEELKIYTTNFFDSQSKNHSINEPGSLSII